MFVLYAHSVSSSQLDALMPNIFFTGPATAAVVRPLQAIPTIVLPRPYAACLRRPVNSTLSVWFLAVYLGSDDFRFGSIAPVDNSGWLRPMCTLSEVNV